MWPAVLLLLPNPPTMTGCILLLLLIIVCVCVCVCVWVCVCMHVHMHITYGHESRCLWRPEAIGEMPWSWSHGPLQAFWTEQWQPHRSLLPEQWSLLTIGSSLKSLHSSLKTNKKTFLHLVMYLCICVSVWGCACDCSVLRGFRFPLEVESQVFESCPMWVLGDTLRSSANAIGDLCRKPNLQSSLLNAC